CQPQHGGEQEDGGEGAEFQRFADEHRCHEDQNGKAQRKGQADILPLRTWQLDVSLAFSLSFSILILMTAVFIRKPLEFSSFPTILLLTTMLRLALNLASTRLILGHGNEGTAGSGYVIQAFGNLVMQGNFVIGLIVFAILIIVNFVVITKGSG